MLRLLRRSTRNMGEYTAHEYHPVKHRVVWESWANQCIPTGKSNLPKSNAMPAFDGLFKPRCSHHDFIDASEVLCQA